MYDREGVMQYKCCHIPLICVRNEQAKCRESKNGKLANTDVNDVGFKFSQKKEGYLLSTFVRPLCYTANSYSDLIIFLCFITAHDILLYI